MGRQELLDYLHCDLLPLLLVLGYQLLKDFYQLLLDLTCQHLATSIEVGNLLQSLVIFHEKSEVLVSYVNSQVGSIFLLFFFCSFSSTECMLFDLCFDLFGLVSHEDS